MLVEFIPIELDLKIIDFLHRFYGLDLCNTTKKNTKTKRIALEIDIFTDIEKKFDDLQTRGYLKNKSFELVIRNRDREDVLDLITYFGKDFSIQFRNNRTREVYFYKFEKDKQKKPIYISRREDDATAFPFDEVLIMPYPEIGAFKWLSQDPLGHPVFGKGYDFSIHRQLRIRKEGGVTYRELNELLKQHLPHYYYWSNSREVDMLRYYWDQKGVPVYDCQSNYMVPDWFSQSMWLKDKNGNLW
jgi:hypothetical protein